MTDFTPGIDVFTAPEWQEKHPCFVLAPQCPAGMSWVPFIDLLARTLYALPREYAIDACRIYVTGVSMGGAGTWALLTACPQRIARRLADLRLCCAVRGARGAPCAGLGLPRRRRPGRAGDGGVPFAARRRRRRHAHGGFEPALRGHPRRALTPVPGGLHGKGMGRAPARLVDGGLPRCGGARVDVLPDAPRSAMRRRCSAPACSTSRTSTTIRCISSRAATRRF